MNPPDAPVPEPQDHVPSDAKPAAIQKLRVVWAASAFGVVAAAAVAVGVTRSHPDPGPVALGGVRVGVIALAVLIALMGVGYYTRLQTYKAGWQRDAVTPSAYLKGNLVLFVLLVIAGLSAIALGTLVGDRFACFGIATAALAALLINFPNGQPMRPAPPRL